MTPDSSQHNGREKHLPKPNARMKLSGSDMTQMTEEEIRGMIANPKLRESPSTAGGFIDL